MIVKCRLAVNRENAVVSVLVWQLCEKQYRQRNGIEFAPRRRMKFNGFMTSTLMRCS